MLVPWAMAGLGRDPVSQLRIFPSLLLISGWRSARV